MASVRESQTPRGDSSMFPKTLKLDDDSRASFPPSPPFTPTYSAARGRNFQLPASFRLLDMLQVLSSVWRDATRRVAKRISSKAGLDLEPSWTSDGIESDKTKLPFFTKGQTCVPILLHRCLSTFTAGDLEPRYEAYSPTGSWDELSTGSSLSNCSSLPSAEDEDNSASPSPGVTNDLQIQSTDIRPVIYNALGLIVEHSDEIVKNLKNKSSVFCAEDIAELFSDAPALQTTSPSSLPIPLRRDGTKSSYTISDSDSDSDYGAVRFCLSENGRTWGDWEPQLGSVWVRTDYMLQAGLHPSDFRRPPLFSETPATSPAVPDVAIEHDDDEEAAADRAWSTVQEAIWRKSSRIEMEDRIKVSGPFYDGHI